jgi:hypothetical protein
MGGPPSTKFSGGGNRTGRVNEKKTCFPDRAYTGEMILPVGESEKIKGTLTTANIAATHPDLQLNKIFPPESVPVPGNPGDDGRTKETNTAAPLRGLPERPDPSSRCRGKKVD